MNTTSKNSGKKVELFIYSPIHPLIHLCVYLPFIYAYFSVYNVLSLISLESRVYAHQMVHTDSKEQKLEPFLHPLSHG